MQEALAGALRYAYIVVVGATSGASAEEDTVLAAGSSTTYCGSSVGYGSYSRTASPVAEVLMPVVLVIASSTRQEAQPQETFGKAAHAQRDKAASLRTWTTTRESKTNAPAKCSPPDNSHGVLHITSSNLLSLVTHAEKIPLGIVFMARVNVLTLLDTG
ncbi:hypothetical protein MRX96_042593 [Rhipicephalus microplus]